MYFLLKMGIFHCYVTLPEGIKSINDLDGKFTWICSLDDFLRNFSMVNHHFSPPFATRVLHRISKSKVTNGVFTTTCGETKRSDPFDFRPFLGSGVTSLHLNLWLGDHLVCFSRWWFQICFIYTLTWGNDPI